MGDNYMSNMSTDLDLKDEAIYAKIATLEQENEALKLTMKEKEKNLNDLQRKYNDLIIEYNQINE